MGLTFEPLGKYVRLVDERNTNLVTESVLGINIDKYFMPSVANVIGTDLGNYKLLRKGRFACNPMHVGRDGRLPVARYTENAPAIVSPAYFMFEIVDENEIEPEYLMLCFRRPDFDRMCWFRTDASVRGGITWEDVCALTIPVPSLPEQQKIVRDYQVVTDRIALLRKLDDNLELQITCIFNDFISHSNEDGWIESTLGGITKHISRGIAPVYDDTSDEIVLNQKCIRGHMVDFTLSRRHVPKTVSDKWVRYGDLLINSTGAGTLGRTALALFDMKNVTVDSHVSIVRPKSKDLIYYIGIWGMTHEAEIEGLQEGSTGQTELPRERLINMPIIVPEANALRRFNKTIIPLFEMRLCFQKEALILISMLDTTVNSLGSVKGA